LALTRVAVIEVINRRARCGEPIPPNEFPALLARLEDLLQIACANETETDAATPNLGQLNQRETLTVAEATEIIGCSEQYVRGIAEEKLGAYKLGRQWAIPLENVLKFAEGKSDDAA
jgi:excisionase family DNA binding protein